MAKAKVMLDEQGHIEKWRFPHYMNSITTKNPFRLEGYVNGHVDCEVIGADGVHIRDSVLDERGNVADVHPVECRALNRERGRLRVGFGNIFGSGFEVTNASEDPNRESNVCHIGNRCVFGAFVVLNSDKGFRIENWCAVGEHSTLKGHVQMLDGATVGSLVSLSPNGSLIMNPNSYIGDKVRIAGGIDMGFGSSLGRLVRVPRNLWIVVPEDAEIPDEYVFDDEFEDLSRYVGGSSDL